MDLIIQRRLPHLGGDWFASECPADLERNGWPVWIGMGGRFTSEYAGCPNIGRPNRSSAFLPVGRDGL
jgi:hypothetical protein